MFKWQHQFVTPALSLGALIIAAFAMPQPGLELDPIYETSSIQWRKADMSPEVVFHPSETLVIVAYRDGRITEIDFGLGKIRLNLSLTHLPCELQDSTPDRRDLSHLEYSPDGKYVLVRFCDKWYLLNPTTFAVSKVLGNAKGVKVSSDGYYIAIQDKDFIRVHAIETWELVGDYASQSGDLLGFSSGRGCVMTALPLYKERFLQKVEVQCRDVSSGQVLENWAIDARDRLYASGLFLARSRVDLVAGYDPLERRVVILHGRTGKPLQTITDDRGIKEVDEWSFHPSGNWLAASVRDEPVDCPHYQQDFKLWDVQTGEVAYATPAFPWHEPVRKEDISELKLRFSHDGRYLARLSFGKLIVYEMKLRN